MPTSIQLPLFDISQYTVKQTRTYSPHRYLARVGWDNKAYAFLKTCTVCFMVGTAPLDSRPTRHRLKPRVELIRRRENRAEMSRSLEYKKDSLIKTPEYVKKQKAKRKQWLKELRMKQSFTVLAQSN